VSAKLQSLIVTYCGSLARDVEAVEHSLSMAAADAGAPHLVEALARVHRIKGAGGSLGFAAVSQAAADLEAHLRSREPIGADAGELVLALESLDRLKQLAASATPEGSTLYGVDLRQHAPRRRRAAHGA